MRATATTTGPDGTADLTGTGPAREGVRRSRAGDVHEPERVSSGTLTAQSSESSQGAAVALGAVPLGLLFLFLCACLLGVAYAAARAGGGAWVIAAAAVAVALWLGSLAVAILKRARR
jgi:hypothetical protein